MNRLSRAVAGTCALAIAVGTAPALAQYSTEFTPAKVLREGKTTHDIAGSGTVKIQVQVNADASHKVVRVISSSNAGDNAAAMDIAQTSTYTPAHRGKTPVVSFYDFVLKFNGKSVSHSDGVAAGGAAASIDALIRAGKYKDAVAKANEQLEATPGDQSVLQLLAVAQYYDGDVLGSAQTFNKVTTVNKTFAPLAAQALANDAVKTAQSDPAGALAMAQKATSLANDNNSRFALGVAQLSNKQYAAAVASLKAVDASMPSSDTKAKINVDQELLQAYLATGDTASASALASKMKALDPNGSSASNAIAQHYLRIGADAMQAKKFDDALQAFDQAAAAGNSADSVTANTYAAFAILRMDKPDYAKAKAYALKALATAPQDASANYAAGIASAGVYVSSHDKNDKAQALDYLNKADQYAKAAGNTALAQQVEAQIKMIPQ
jgi:tetratricopeptide (TPR) repeat protein